VSGAPGVPEGFTALRSAGTTLIAADTCVETLVEAQLETPSGWQGRLAESPAASGRGGQGRLEAPGGTLILKQLRRGGLPAALWRDRFPGTARLIANLTTPLEVERRGIATARPVALLVVPGPPGLYRGFLATRQIPGAVDLRRRFVSGPPPSEPELGAALGLVRRMHDAGIEHPDLNLGNLLLRLDESGPCAWVIDLDRARLSSGPLAFAARQRAVRRLERSYLKVSGERSGGPDWYALYAAGSRELLDGFRRGRSTGNLLHRLHRLGWRNGS